MALGEANTCRKYIVPLLQSAGWDDEQHVINEQRTFTDGRVIFVGGKTKRSKQKRAGYLLRYRPDFPIAIVEAKARYKSAAVGVQQAKDYVEILGLKFAYASNGAEITEVDYTTGIERSVPTPALGKQLSFDRLQGKVRKMLTIREQAVRDADALLPAMLHEIFGDREA